MGKGSKQRPTDKSKFDDNFDRIFKDKGEKKDDRLQQCRDTNRKPRR